MYIPDIMTANGRRAWSFAAIVGGCMVNTVYLFVVTFWLKGEAEYLFYLALADVALIFVGMTALGWALGRRMLVSASRDGVTINDSHHVEVQTRDK